MSCHHPHARSLPPRSLALRETPFPRHFLATTTPLPSTTCPFSPVSLIPPLSALALSILHLLSARPSRVSWGPPVTRLSIRSTTGSSVCLGLYSSNSHVSVWRAFIASRTISWTISLRGIFISRPHGRSSRPINAWRSASMSPRSTFCLPRHISGDASSSSSVRYLFFVRLRRH